MSAISKNINAIRYNIAKQIVACNIILISFSVIGFLSGGFDHDEFSGIIALLVSISAIYIAPVTQFIGKQISGEVVATKDIVCQIPYGKLIRTIIFIHFGAVLGVLVLKAWPLINYWDMNILITLIEVVFGAYIGHIITALFQLKDKKEQL
ncbi:MAG: hypothetical protein AB8E82_13615 [Aureispira sp.]